MTIFLNCFNDKSYNIPSSYDALGRGNFTLDDPIEKFIPEFKNHRILKKI